MDDRRAERRRPHRGQPQPGRPRVLRVLDAALHARVALAGGRASRSARRPARRASATSSRPAGSPASAAPPRRPSTSSSRPGPERDIAPAAIRAREPDECGYATRGRRAAACTGRSTAAGARRSCSCRRRPISHSRIWKAQVHYLARHHRVVVYDGRGNGSSDVPDTSRRRGCDGWVRIGLPGGDGRHGDRGAPCSSASAATASGRRSRSPPRIPSACSGSSRSRPGVPLLTPPHPWRGRRARALRRSARATRRAGRRRTATTSCADHARLPRVLLRRDVPGAALDQAGRGRRRLRARRAGRGAGDGRRRPVAATKEEVEAICRRVRCPVLVVQGDRDNCQPFERGLALAELTGAEHVHARRRRATSRWRATRCSSTG